MKDDCRNWAVLLYPDCKEHKEALEKLQNGDYDYIAILHGRDVDDNGALKKAHYHVCIKYPNAVVKTSVASSLGVEENYIGKINNWRKATQYLIHYNDDTKYQYPISDVFGVPKLIEELEKSVIEQKEESLRVRMSDIKSVLKRNLRLLRQSAGLTQEDVAAKIGVSKSYYWQLENANGKTPSFKILEKLSVLYKIEYYQFFTNKADTIEKNKTNPGGKERQE